MLKQEYVIRMAKGFEKVNGYVTEDGIHGVDKRGDKWFVTDIATGIGFMAVGYPTRKSAIADIERLENIIAEKGIRDSESYKTAIEELKEFKGESEDKTMAKTTKTSKKADEVKALKNENEALRKEIEMLKASIKALEPTVTKVTIDEFNVEQYMASRDDSARITPELVEALENTKGLTVTRKGKDEWLYVSGKTEADTKERKDIFKAMGFKWSAPEKAWFIAPYPLRSKKNWGAKKARMAMATA